MAGAGDRADRYGQENIAIPTDDTSNWCYDNRRKLRPEDKLRRLQGGANKCRVIDRKRISFTTSGLDILLLGLV